MTLHRNFSFQPGYAEDAYLCEMPVSHDTGFATIEEAVEQFRLTLVSYLEVGRKKQKCCVQYAKEEDFEFCPGCGHRLADVREADADAVADLFMKMPMMTVDEASGNGLTGHFAKAGWQLGQYRNEDEPVVSVRAVERWMAREDEHDRPFLEGTYPDGTCWSSYDKRP